LLVLVHWAPRRTEGSRRALVGCLRAAWATSYTLTADERRDRGVISVLLHNSQLNVQTIPSIEL